MQIYNLLAAMITDKHKEGAVSGCHTIADQRWDARIQLLPHGCGWRDRNFLARALHDVPRVGLAVELPVRDAVRDGPAAERDVELCINVVRAVCIRHKVQ